MSAIPVRKIIEVHSNQMVVLECGHRVFMFGYGLTEMNCEDCSIKGKIDSNRGRAAFKCQSAVDENVWDTVGEVFREMNMWTVKDAVYVAVVGDEIPF